MEVEPASWVRSWSLACALILTDCCSALPLLPTHTHGGDILVGVLTEALDSEVGSSPVDIGQEGGQQVFSTCSQQHMNTGSEPGPLYFSVSLLPAQGEGTPL